MSWVQPTGPESGIPKEGLHPVGGAKKSTLFGETVVNLHQNGRAAGVPEALAKSPKNIFLKSLNINLDHVGRRLSVTDQLRAGSDVNLLTGTWGFTATWGDFVH